MTMMRSAGMRAHAVTHLKVCCKTALGARPSAPPAGPSPTRLLLPTTPRPPPGGSQLSEQALSPTGGMMLRRSVSSLSSSSVGTNARRSGTGTGSGGPNASTSGRQPVDYTTLVASIKELGDSWMPAKVERVIQMDRHTLALGLRTLEGSGWLYICWEPTSSRVAVGPPPPRERADGEGFSFGEVLKARLPGLALVGASVPEPWERVARLSFGVRPTDPPEVDLWVEVCGRYSNVVAADSASGAIAACAFQVGAKQSRARTLRTGEPYALPPPVAGSEPSAVGSAAELADMAVWAAGTAGDEGGSLLQGLVRGFRGVSPSIAAELAALAGVDVTSPAGALGDAAWEALYGEWGRWLAALEAGSFEPGVREGGGYSVLGGDLPYNLGGSEGEFIGGDGGDGGAIDPAGGVHAMLHDYYAGVHGGERFRQLREALVVATRRAEKKLASKTAQFWKALESAEEADVPQARADLIMGFVHAYEKGEAHLDCVDYETGEAVRVEIDPREGPVEEAKRLYKRAKKLRRTADSVAPLLEAAEGEAEYLEGVASSLEQLDRYRGRADLKALAEIQEELVASGYMRAPPDESLRKKGGGGKKNRSKEGPTALMREFESPGGFPVVVGRNNKQNDALSLSVANEHDTWFHAQGCPGAHVILRVPPGKEAPDADVQYAADLAAFFSKARDSTKVPVICTNPKHLKRPKGGKPGQVIVPDGTAWTVMARPGDSAGASVTESGEVAAWGRGK